jgi:hypothetical protein
MLGGSSGINYMMWATILIGWPRMKRLTHHRYSRGSSQDYDDWAALADDASWSHSEMTRYMRKHQTLEPINDAITDVSGRPHVCAAPIILRPLTS